ncbi:MAG: IS5 family transposase, partial [Magnetococcus sp. YQC-9]
LKKNGPQAIGRSKGGLTTKIHASVDALGNPMKYILTGGQEADITQAHALIEGMNPDVVIADKGYDANHFVEAIEAKGAEPVIPPRSNRLNPREYDHHWYKDRNLVERFFNRIKQFRRIATRYEKLDKCFKAMIGLVCTMIWLE